MTEPTVGSAAHEAARLLESLGGWFAAPGRAVPGEAASGATPPRGAAPGRAAPPADGPAGPAPAGPAPAGAAHDVSSCRACPVCRGIDAVRSVHPELVEQLATAAESLAAALRGLTASAAQPTGTPADAPTPRPTSADPVHIPVRDDDVALHDHDDHHTHGPARGLDEQDGAAAWG